MTPKRDIIYCFVDETGQDASSRFFTAVAVVTTDELETLRKQLLDAEVESGVGQRKWHKSSDDRKQQFLKLVIKRKIAQGDIFFGTYEKPLPYFMPMLDTITKAIRHKVSGDYETRVYVDGIDRRKARELTNALRVAGIRLGMVKSRRDESEPLIRLADRWAGCIREGIAKREEYSTLLARAKRNDSITDITQT